MFSTLFRVLFSCIVFYSSSSSSSSYYYYYYYFSIKHQNNPPPQNPPLATVTHPAIPAPTSNQTYTPWKTTKNLQPTHYKNLEIYTKPTTSHPKNWRPTAPKNPQQPKHRKPLHPKTHNNPNTTSHRTKPINTKHNKPTKQQKNSQKIQSFRTMRLQIMAGRERSKVRRVGAQVGLQICFNRRWRWRWFLRLYLELELFHSP